MAFSSGILKTSEKALRYFQDIGLDFDSLVMSHVHRVGSYSVGKYNLYEQGCCCDTSKMEYADGKLTTPQREGFIVVYQDKDGKLIESKTHIVRLN